MTKYEELREREDENSTKEAVHGLAWSIELLDSDCSLCGSHFYGSSTGDREKFVHC